MSMPDSTKLSEPNPSGLCMCGCGQPTPLAKQSDVRKGWVKGKPTRYAYGHNRSRRSPKNLIGPNPGGLCMCGCGKAAPVAARTTTREGVVKGEPKRYIKGHQPRPGVPPKNPVEYIEQNCGHPTPCWIWQRARLVSGYGVIGCHPSRQLAHRVYYERFKGPIADGLTLDHLCRVAACVNPDHLEPVTQRVNTQRGARAILSQHKADEIRRLRADGWSRQALADRFGVAIQTIGNVLYGDAWR